MEIAWPDHSCEAIQQFVDHILAGYYATITDIDGDVFRVLVQGWSRETNEAGLLTVFGQLLDEEYELIQPRRHFWTTWDSIAKLEIH